MAYTAYRSATTAEGFYITLYVEETVGSAAQNTSTIKWYATATTTTSVPAVEEFPIVLKVAGDTVSRSYVRPLSAGAVTNLVAPGSARSVTVQHALDGTGSFSMSVTEAGVSILSLTAALTEIARQTYPSSLPASVALGASVSLSLVKPLAGSSCTISLKVGSHTEVLVNKTTAASLSVTVPASLIDYCTSTPQAVQWIFRTYDSAGNNLGGFIYNKYLTFSYAISVDTPECEVVATQAVYTAGYLQGYSKVKVSYAASPSAEYGGNIASVKISLSDGQSVTKNTASGDWTSAVLQGSGTITVTVKATDTRGVTATATATINVAAYVPPTNSFIAERCDANKTPNPSGEYYYYAISGTAQNIGSNAGQLSVNGANVGAAAVNPSYESAAIPLAVSSTLTLTGAITDYFGRTARITVEIPQGVVYMQFGGGTNERGVAIGGESTRDMLEVFLPTDFTQNPTVNGVPLGGSGMTFTPHYSTEGQGAYDANDLPNGFYYFSAGVCSNLPLTTLPYYVCSLRISSTNCKQYASATNSNTLLTRRYADGWTGWTAV